MPAPNRLTPREAYAAHMLGSVLVDVRESDLTDAKSLDVRRSIHLPLRELGQRYTELPASRGIILISERGATSSRAADFLVEQGIQDVSVVIGGILAWEKEGLPIRQTETSEAN